MTDCLECGAPAEPVGRVFGLAAVGFDGEDTVVWFQVWACVAGHRYQVEVWMDEETDDRRGYDCG